MSVSSIHHLAERRLTELGITLPVFPQPVANYVPFVTSGNLLFISGQGPRAADGTYITGKVGRDVAVDEVEIEAIFEIS
jgi:enamine deaminase RidA (YjgF/YER057c/UK114 family)